MAEKLLDVPQVRAVPQQVRCAPVAQPMRFDRLAVPEPCRRLDGLDYAGDPLVVDPSAAIDREQVGVSAIRLPDGQPLPEGRDAVLADIQFPALAALAGPHQQALLRKVDILTRRSQASSRRSAP